MAEAGDDFRLVAPVDLEAKARARRSGRYRSRPRGLNRAVYDGRLKRHPLRGGFNSDDFRVAREIVDRYCPAAVPRRLRAYFKGPMALFDALLVYVMTVEFAWGMDAIAPHIGRSRWGQRQDAQAVEQVRDLADFIEAISERAQEYRHGLL